MDRILIRYLDIDLKSAFRNLKSAVLASLKTAAGDFGAGE